jgi:hypothetical protein
MSALKQSIASTTMALNLKEDLTMTTVGGNAALDTSHDFSCSASGQIANATSLNRFALIPGAT